MNDTIFFKSIFPYNATLLIGGSDSRSDQDTKYRHESHVRYSGDSVLLSLVNLMRSYDVNISVYAGTGKPRNHKKLTSKSIACDNKLVYIGNLNQSQYMILEATSKTVDIVLYTQKTDDSISVYIQFKTDVILHEESLDTESIEVQNEISRLGSEQGCHICGRKDGEFIPHLLPPTEFGGLDKQSWHPICKTDYTKYKNEMQQILKDKII